MAKATFVGGVQVPNKKSLSLDKPIRKINPKSELVYPMVQHVGEAAVPVVEKGDHVLLGQKIAEASGHLSVPVYASVSGTVLEIEERSLITGKKVMSIIVENDGANESVEFTPQAPLSKMSAEDIIDVIKEAGIVDAGGSGIPTHIKLMPPNPDKVDYVIMNCVESESYGSASSRLLMEQSEKALKGLRILLKLFENARGVLAVEDHNHDVKNLLNRLVKEDTRVSVKAVAAKYPQHAEQQLIYAITGRKISLKKIASEHKCIILNVETILAIYEAVMEGKPFLDRVLTVSGERCTKPCNLRVPLGTSYKDIAAAGGCKPAPPRFVCGDSMTGLKVTALKAPVTKTSGGLLALDEEDGTPEVAGECIHCGRCVEACPARLVPTKLCDAAENNDKKAFALYCGGDCTECGSCSYVCPAKIDLTQKISAMHKGIAKKKKVPHLRSNASVIGIALALILSLMPLVGYGIATFGLSALWTILTAVGAALVAEVGYDIYVKKWMVFDMSTLAFAFIFALLMPSTMPLWLVAIGAVILVFVHRMGNGLLGKFKLNPVAVATLILGICGIFTLHGEQKFIGAASLVSVLVGACLLILTGVVDLKIPGCFLLGFSLIQLFFGGLNFDMMYLMTQLTNSAAVVIAFFVVTEYSSRPNTIKGHYIYGAVMGVLFGLTWQLGLGSIGGSVVLLLGNLLAPYIEMYTLPIPFGSNGRSTPEKSVIKKVPLKEAPVKDGSVTEDAGK